MGNCAAIFLLRWYATSTWKTCNTSNGIFSFFFSFSSFFYGRRRKPSGESGQSNPFDFIRVFVSVRIETKSERFNLNQLDWATLTIYCHFFPDLVGNFFTLFFSWTSRHDSSYCYYVSFSGFSFSLSCCALVNILWSYWRLIQAHIGKDVLRF